MKRFVACSVVAPNRGASNTRYRRLEKLTAIRRLAIHKSFLRGERLGKNVVNDTSWLDTGQSRVEPEKLESKSLMIDAE